MKQLFITLLILFSVISYSQRGKDGNVTINSSAIINEYTFLSSNASAGQNTLTVDNSSLNQNGRFSTSLEEGDLIFVYQAQGVSLSTAGTTMDWGSITSYNNCGNYEFCEVSSVPNSTTININCGLKNSYTASGNVQIIRVPRYNSLTVNDQINCAAWDGEIGGIIVIESLNDISIGTNGSIDASELGFRGGIEDYAASGIGTWAFALTNSDGGGVKGESLFGYENDYTAVGGKYGYGAPANGGGGGNNHNAGGGGGGNGSSTSLWNAGVGVPDPTYNAAWALESPSIAGVTSSGGGKGGYTFSQNSGNPLLNGPNNYSAWGGDGRRPLGGLGGRPLDYSSGRIFFGGGGGSGDINDAETLGGHGGNGGGIIFIRSYGSIQGNGAIVSNGENGEDAYSTNPPAFDYAGNDGAGGGGAGGTIILSAVDGIDANISVSAVGGNGGNQVLSSGFLGPSSYNEGEGPGGGGSGGFVQLSHTMSLLDISGGQNGVTNCNGLAQFPPNGATSGGQGNIEVSSPLFEISAENDTICAGNSTTLIATVSGSLPGGTSIIWYDAPSNGNFIGAGTNFTTGNISNDTTFYVGFCPGNYTIPVSVIMGTSFNFDTTNVIISDENCSLQDGSITGITVSGGAQPLQYEWNAVLTADQNLNNVSAGTYTLIITDNNGCAANLGTYTIGENTGPSIDTTGMIVQDDQCNQSVGSISGIVVTGQSPFNYTWNSISSSGPDQNNIPSGLYDLEVTDGYGCSSLIEDILVDDLSGPSIDTTNMIVQDDHCGQGIGSISGITFTGASPFTYTWNGISTLSQDTINLEAGNYELIMTDTYGCSDTISDIVVADISSPSIDTSNMIISPEICENVNGAISGIIVSGSGPFTYYWDGDTSSLDISGVSSGSYDLLVEDSFGCSTSVLDILVTENGFPQANISYSPSEIFAGDTVVFIDESNGNIISSTFTLSDGTLVNDTMALEVYGDRGVYDICLLVENSFGCFDSTCIEITVSPVFIDLVIPNIFTPNQDGINDYFSIEGVENYYSIQIYNRWGQIVFSENPYITPWDGMAGNGKPLSEGTYYYILEYVGDIDNVENQSGVVFLQR